MALKGYRPYRVIELKCGINKIDKLITICVTILEKVASIVLKAKLVRSNNERF